MEIKQLFNGLINFVLPNSCICCEEILGSGENFICGDCHAKLVRHTEEHPWKSGEISRGTIDDSFSLYQFHEGTEIQTLLHSLKYEKMKSIGKLLGREIGEVILERNKIKYDCAIPVPLHKAKEKERTFNQSYYICKGIAEATGALVMENSIRRTRFTQTQTRLDRSARKNNVSGAFMVNPKFIESVRGKNIILADDVITTGATILECAAVLKQNGAGKVLICSAAYAVLD